MKHGDILKSYIQAKGITQAELGRLMGKQRQDIYHLLKRTTFHNTTLLSLREAIDFEISDATDLTNLIQERRDKNSMGYKRLYEEAKEENKRLLSIIEKLT